jgi:formylglycine-generating enzyme required for sulfatase activity
MRCWTLGLVLALMLARVALMPLHAAEEELVAVMDLTPQGSRPEEALAVTNQLRTQLLKTGKFTLVDRSQMEAILDEQAFQQTGCTSEECAVQVGKILGVRKIVSGSVTKLSEQLWQVSLLMLDVESAKTLRAETETYEGSLVTVIRAGVPDLAARLAGAAAAAPPPPAPAPAQQQAAVAPTQPGTLWREPITGMEFVHVPGGEYEQGCHTQAGECDDDERPSRRVRLSPFWIGKTEVTQGQWSRVMGSNPSGFKNGDDYPVENVSWNDVQEFIQRLNSRTPEVRFRLPSEAEWEYACRAGGKPIEYGTQGGEISRRTVNYGKDVCCEGDASDGYLNTAPVGSFAGNGLGLHDMSGNVWEWVQDVYDRKAYQSGATSDPIYQGSGALRVLRGGGWSSRPRGVRCSVRGRYEPDDRSVNLGFRLAGTK